MKLIQVLAIVSIIGSTLLFGTEYHVDTEKSMVTFKIRHAVIAKVEGKFNQFFGTFEYDEKSHTFISFTGKAEMNSVNTDNEYRDKHLRAKVFNVEKYPEMELKLIQQDGSSFLSDLTIKGVTNRVDFSISILADNQDIFILAGEINRKDFNLSFSDMAEVGGIVVGEKVEINILFSGK